MQPNPMEEWIRYSDLVKMGPWSSSKWRKLVAARVLKVRRLGHRTVLISRRSVEAYLGAS